MKNEASIIGQWLMELKPAMVWPLLAEFAPSFYAHRPCDVIDKAVSLEILSTLTSLPAGELDAVRFVFNELEDMRQGFNRTLSLQDADRRECLNRLAADLNPEELTSWNILVWALLNAPALWLDFETRTYDLKRTPLKQKTSGETLCRYRVHPISDFCLLREDDRKLQVDRFANACREDFLNFVDKVDGTVGYSEYHDRFHVDFSFSYSRVAIKRSQKGTRRIPKDINGETVSLDYNPLRGEVTATGRHMIFVKRFTADFVEKVLHLTVCEHCRRHYDLSRFASRETARLELPDDSPFQSVSIRSVLARLHYRGYSLVFWHRFSGDSLYEDIERLRAEKGNELLELSIAAVTIALNPKEPSDFSMIPEIELSTTGRTIKGPCGMGYGSVVKLLSTWDLDGVISRDWRTEFSEFHVRNLLNNLGLGYAKVRKSGDYWITDRVRLPGGKCQRLAIAPVADEKSGLEVPRMIAIDDSIIDVSRIKAFMEIASPAAKLAGFEIALDEKMTFKLTAVEREGAVSASKSGVKRHYRTRGMITLERAAELTGLSKRTIQNLLKNPRNTGFVGLNVEEYVLVGWAVKYNQDKVQAHWANAANHPIPISQLPDYLQKQLGF